MAGIDNSRGAGCPIFCPSPKRLLVLKHQHRYYEFSMSQKRTVLNESEWVTSPGSNLPIRPQKCLYDPRQMSFQERGTFACNCFLTRTGSSASAGSQIVPGFMPRSTHVSSPVIRSRKWHFSCTCRTSRSCRAPFNRFALRSSSRKRGTHLKYRLFILREVVRWRCTVDAGILRNSAIVRTEDQDLYSSNIDISKRDSAGARSVTQIGRCHLISCSQYFTLLPSNTPSW
jgi:hypothetical protein